MKRGFTLIELLAVIVIISVISLITVPVVINTVVEAREKAFISSVDSVFKSMERYYVEEQAKELGGQYEVVIKNNNQISVDKIDLDGKLPLTSYSYVDNFGNIAVVATDGNIVVERSFLSNEASIISEDPETFDIVDRYRVLKNQMDYTFSCGKDVIDLRDGNVYNTIEIAGQCWFTRDLAYDCSLEGYNNIGNAADPLWTGSNNCGNQGLGYEGISYQWPVAMNMSTTEGDQGLCPSGWHIPTNAEWITLTDSLGLNPGEKLKAITPTWNGTNTVGFNALPTGWRGSNGKRYDVNTINYWWTSTPNSVTHTWRRRLETASTEVLTTVNSNTNAFSIRCINTN